MKTKGAKAAKGATPNLKRQKAVPKANNMTATSVMKAENITAKRKRLASTKPEKAQAIQQTLKEVVKSTEIVKAPKGGKLKNQAEKRMLDVQNEGHASSSRTMKAKKQKASLLEVPKIPTEEGAVYVLGANDVGQLGLPLDIDQRKKPTVLDLVQPIVDIAAGGMHSVCLTGNGKVYTFGCNDDGMLGRKTEEEEESAAPEIIDLPEKIVMISAGDTHTAALSEKGNTYIWGNFRNNSGVMGLTPNGRQEPKPLRILEGVRIVKIASGNEHLVCLSDSGQVFTFGCGEVGQLGRVSQRTALAGGRKAVLLVPALINVLEKEKGRLVKFDNIWTGHYAIFLRSKDSGNIYASGLNNYCQLGYEGDRDIPQFHPTLVNTFGKDICQISGGQHHTLSLANSGLVSAFGRKEYGRLGLGNIAEDPTEPTVIPALSKVPCSSVSCGNITSFAVSNSGSVYSWGMGDCYQLGHNSDDGDILVPTVIGGKLSECTVLKVAGGGQHTLILASKINR